MNKRLGLVLLSLLMSVYAMASDTSVKNADGVEIWYYFDSYSQEASVTYPPSYSNEYSGEIVIPSTVTYDGVEYSVTSIGYYAFYNCSGLTSVTIPDGVTSIGDQAFRDCSGLTSVAIPESVTSIGYEAFRDCSGLTSVTIPDGVTSIVDYAFSGCSGLTSVTIPDGVTSIGSYAFNGCNGLEKVYYEGTIADWCSIELSDFGSNPFIYVRHLYIGNEEVNDLVIPEGVTSIRNYAFSGCSGLTSVTIPEGVTSIGEHAFSGCI